jgi:vancomycin resistance protein VanJ
LLLAALIWRRWSLVLLFAVPGALFLWAYGGQFVPAAAALSDADVRVATFNTWVHAPGVDHVVDVATTSDADVLLLQEVFPERFEALERALGERYPHGWHARRTDSVGGVAVLSRYPITATVDVDAGGHSRTTGVVTLDVAGRPLQVVPLHLVSPCPGCGRSLSERLTFEASTRRAEIAAVTERLVPGVPAVVGGDLNSNDRSDAYRSLVAAGFDDPHRQVGSGPGFTWPGRGPTPLLRIDWILTRGVDPVAEWVGGADGSDHRPVVVDIAFRD